VIDIRARDEYKLDISRALAFNFVVPLFMMVIAVNRDVKSAGAILQRLNEIATPTTLQYFNMWAPSTLSFVLRVDGTNPRCEAKA
jgi:hypothetical protein